MAAYFVGQHRMRRALCQLAAEVGWTDLKRPWITGTKIADGLWNGHRVALRYWPPGRGTPAFVAAEILLPLTGRLEMRARPAKEPFWNRPLPFFRPPVIELVDPADARFRAWGDDRTLVDRFLALPGVRPSLEINLCGREGVLTMKKGILRIRTPVPRGKLFDVGDRDKAREIARAEWDLIAAAANLG